MQNRIYSVFATFLFGIAFALSIFGSDIFRTKEISTVYADLEPKSFVPERPKMICCRPTITRIKCVKGEFDHMIGRSINGYKVLSEFGCLNTVTGIDENDTRKKIQSGGLGIIVNEFGTIQKILCVEAP